MIPFCEMHPPILCALRPLRDYPGFDRAEAAEEMIGMNHQRPYVALYRKIQAYTHTAYVRRIRSKDSFFIICVLLAVFKLLLVSQEEIIARNQPFDDFWQIMAASRGYWFGSEYNVMTFVHLPVYPIWIALVYFTGIPLRIVSELLFLGAGFVFALVLTRAGVQKCVATVCYSLIIFHPASFQLFNYTLADTIYAPILLLALACLILIWIHRESRRLVKYALLTGLVFGALWYVRKENVLLLVIFSVFALAIIYVLWRERRTPREVIRYVGLVVLIPVGIMLSVSALIQTANWAKFGLFVSSDMNASGYTAAYRALLRIKPDKSIRFVPVPGNVRQKAYAVSPAFRELAPYFEGEFGYAMASETRKWMGISNEIAAGWFYWALRQAAALAGHHRTAKEANTYYQRIADEINAAIDNGQLIGRPVFLDFLDPDLFIYLPYFLSSLQKIGGLFTSTDEPQRVKDDTVAVSEQVCHAFDVVANRRAALIAAESVVIQGSVVIRGWVFIDKSSVKKVSMRTLNGQILGSTDQFSSRPDVAKSFYGAGIHDIPANTGFALLVVGNAQQLSDISFVVESSEGVEYAYPCNKIAVGRPIEIADAGFLEKVVFAYDAVSPPWTTDAIRESLQGMIWVVYGRLLTYLGYIGIVALLIIVIFQRTVVLPAGVSIILLLLFCTIITRVFLFALIDVSSWPSNQARYLFPAMQLYGCFLTLLIYQAFRILNMTVQNRLKGLPWVISR
jgi:hypothetical protein